MSKEQSEVVFDHVAVGVSDPALLTPLVVGQLGARPYASGPGAGFEWWQYRFEGDGLLEVLQPAGPPGGFLHRFLDARGPGVHHVTFKVPDHAVALQRATDLGYEMIGVSHDYEGWKEAFLHPKQAQGIVIQIVESSPRDASDSRDDEEEDWSRPFPQAPAPGQSVELLGPLLNVHDGAGARRQWETLLLGSCEENDAGFTFHWPGSAMHVRVTIDSSRPEGPIGLEVGGHAELGLPEGPHPLLGTALLPVRRPR